MIFENKYIDRKIRIKVGIIIIGFLLMVAVTDAIPFSMDTESDMKIVRTMSYSNNSNENRPILNNSPDIIQENKDLNKNQIENILIPQPQEMAEKNTDLFYLKNGYAIRIISVDNDISPPKLWIALEKEEIKIDDEILNSGDEYSYSKDFDELKVRIEVFADGTKGIVFLKDLYQSSNGDVLINYESTDLYLDSISSYQSTNDLIYSNSPVSSGINIQQAASIEASSIRQITVDDDGPADYNSIQHAIDAANKGDIIYVKNGTYLEHLLIVKNNLTIIGENKDSTIIDGGGEGEVVVLMGANNNTLKEITVQNGKPYIKNFPPVFGNQRVFLKENYSIVLNAIDARAYPRQAWITLFKNNTKLDDYVIIEGGTYNYVNNTGKLILSLKMDNVFAGTSSDYIAISNVTQYSEKNLNVIVQNEKALLKAGNSDDFIPLNGGIEWELYENYDLNILDMDERAYPRQTMLLLSKNGAPVDLKIITAGEMYTYYKAGKLILRADIESIFGGTGINLVKLSHVYQYAESTPSLLLNDGMHLYTVGSPKPVKWNLFQNYSLSAMDIDSKSFPRQVWFELSKDGVVVEDKIIQSGNNHTFYKVSSKILNLSLGEILDGRNADLAIVSKVYQYSETNPGIILMQNQTHLFLFGGSSGIDWQLYENYTVSFMETDIKIFPAQVWMRMKKNGEIVDDKVVAINQTYSYTNPSGRLIFNAKIDTIFSGNLDFLKITNAYQYSEVGGTPLILNSTRSFYPRNIEYFEGLNSRFVLYENYVIIPVDISNNPRQVWMRLYKNNALVDEKILDMGQNYSYYNGGRKIISAKVDSIFVGATADMMQFRDFYQYSETNGAILMYVQKQTLATGTRISKNNAGITLVGSNENKFFNLEILNNYYGIYLKNSSFNNINDNNIQNNSDPRFYANPDAGGILLSSSSTNNTIRANSMTNNSNGVYIKYTYSYLNGSYVDLQSINNLIYSNNFINNIRNGYSDYFVNQWDNGYFEGGNYWSDYSGIDGDHDGIGDTPYSSNGVWDRYPFMKPDGWQSINPTVSFDVSKLNLSLNSIRRINLTLDQAPAGLSGYNITISLSNGTVAEIISVDYPRWASLNSSSTLPGDSVWLKASDLSNSIQNGSRNIPLATMNLRGDAAGKSNILITVTSMDDDTGSEIDPSTIASIVEVSAVVRFPCDVCIIPTDPDGDGLYEDINGNGRKDFNDVVLFFNYLEWIPDNEPIVSFDFNSNGRIDFNDIIKLFEEL